MRSPQRAQYSSPASTLAHSIRRRMWWAGPYPRAVLDTRASGEPDASCRERHQRSAEPGFAGGSRARPGASHPVRRGDPYEIETACDDALNGRDEREPERLLLRLKHAVL